MIPHTGPALPDDSAQPPPPTEPRPGRRMRFLRRTGLFLVLCWLTVVVMLSFVQRRLMYFPERADRLPVASFPTILHRFPESQDVEFPSTDGHRVRGWYLKQDSSRNAARPLVIFFHGNGGNRGGRVGWYDVLADVDCDVLAIDYQGYGDSEGKPSQTALENDARAAWAFAVDHLGRDPENIVVMGVSLGGAVAVALAAEQCRNGPVPAGLVTVATFSSMVEVAASKYRWVPVRAVLLDRYPSADRISQVTVPFLHFHGEDDRIVEPEFGRRLFEQAPERSATNIPRRWVTLPQTGHNDILLRSRRIVLEELRRFVRSVAAAPAER